MKEHKHQWNEQTQEKCFFFIIFFCNLREKIFSGHVNLVGMRESLTCLYKIPRIRINLLSYNGVAVFSRSFFHVAHFKPVDGNSIT